MFPGVYFEQVRFNGKNLYLTSLQPENERIVEQTVIDAQRQGTVVAFNGEETGACALDGFTIRNGFTRESGAGIDGAGCRAIIRHNIITENTCDSIDSESGGAGVFDCDGAVLRNRIHLNRSNWHGAGIFECDGLVANNTITSNTAGHYEEVLVGDRIVIVNFGVGGGIARCDGYVRNNTVLGNHAFLGGGGLSGARGDIRNGIYWFNTSNGLSRQLTDYRNVPNYCCIQNWSGGGVGNITNAPKFVNGAEFDYRLSSDSPCVDAGAPEAEYEDGCHPPGLGSWRNDMGAFGGENNCVDEDPKAPPHIDVETPLENVTVPSSVTSYRFSGVAYSDVGTLARVEYRVDGGEWTLARGLSVWSFTVEDLPEGQTTVDVRAVDTEGLQSLIVTRAIVRRRFLDPDAVHVDINGGADFTAIQTAIDSVEDGTKIVVHPGVYGENVLFRGKNLTLTSLDPYDSDTVAVTIIDALESGSGVRFSGSETEAAVLSGFTINAGRALFGGGVRGGPDSATRCRARISGNVFVGNTADKVEEGTGRGGAIAFCDGPIVANHFASNSASAGGAVAHCDGPIHGNTLTTNTALSEGGAFYDCDGSIRNNRFWLNRAPRGSALALCDGEARNNIMDENLSTTGGAVHDCRALLQNNVLYGNRSTWGRGAVTGLYPEIVDCLIWENSPGEDGRQLDPATTNVMYSCVQNWDGQGGENFADAPGLEAPQARDFRLTSTSICIDRGDPAARRSDGALPPGQGSPRGDVGAYGGPANCGWLSSGTLTGYTFLAGSEGWLPFAPGGDLTLPEFDSSTGALSILSTSNDRNFGFWVGPIDETPIISDSLHHASFLVDSNLTDSAAAPTIRLRVNASSLQQANLLIVNSSGAGECSPTSGGRLYDLLFESPHGAREDSWQFSFDLMNFAPDDAATAVVTLRSLVVDRHDAPLPRRFLHAWRFEEGTDNWGFSGPAGDFTPPIADSGDGALSLTSVENQRLFGFWTSPVNDVALETTGGLVRCLFRIRSDIEDFSLAPTVRLRASAGAFREIAVLRIDSHEDARNSPRLAPREFPVYLRAEECAMVGGLECSFDMLNFNPLDSPTGTLYLENVRVEEIDLDLP